MSDSIASIANRNGYQQLGSLMAERSAQQAEEQAKTLRRQADAAQQLADNYREKAQTLDSQANKAQVKSNDMKTRLTVADGFQHAAGNLTVSMANAEVKPDTYTRQGTTTSAASSAPSLSGSYLNTKA